MRLIVVVFAIAAAGWLVDRLTKQWAVRHLASGDRSYLGGFLRLILTHNSGAAFSFGTSATIAFTILAAVATLIVVAVVVPRLERWSRAVITGMALAGITGNLTDRLTQPPGHLRGHVIDFVALPHFAIFNVADVFITCTAIALLLFSLAESRRPASGQVEQSDAADRDLSDKQDQQSASGHDSDRAVHSPDGDDDPASRQDRS